MFLTLILFRIIEYMVINYVDDIKLGWIINVRFGVELGFKRSYMSVLNLIKRINVGLYISV